MYCPKCAAPIDGVKFCRQCGTNVSLIPQALTGQLPAPASTNATPPAITTANTRHERGRHRRQQLEHAEPPSMSHAFNHVLFGLGFLVAAALVSRNASWGWVFIFPAMGAFGKAVSEYYRAAEAQQQFKAQSFQPPQITPPVLSQPPLQVPTTAELKLPAAAQDLAQPVSITEHTTALLEPARQKAAEKN